MDPVPVYLDELVGAIVCTLLVLIFGTQGQSYATVVAVVGASFHSPPLIAFSILMAWVSNRERK